MVKNFLGFALLSGLGWLCDFATFSLLVNRCDSSGFVANFIASYVGVTFVWFTALKTVFSRGGSGDAVYLPIYWGFQFASILMYSQSLHVLDISLQIKNFPSTHWQQPELAAKILVTPFNLVTNFLFMKFLTRFMRQR